MPTNQISVMTTTAIAKLVAIALTQARQPRRTTSTGLKMPMNRTSGSSRKVSWIVLRDRRTAPLD